MNLFTFTGNLGNDCQVKQTKKGKTIANFSVAVRSGWGEYEKTTWVSCTLFGQKAEGQLPQYLTKGAQVAVSGELTLEEWQDNNGITQKTLEIAVEKLDLIGGKQQAQQQPQQQRAPQPQQQAPQRAPAPQQQQWQQPQQQAPQRQAAGGVGYQPPSQPQPNDFDDDMPF